jgi:hypothetical protein
MGASTSHTACYRDSYRIRHTHKSLTNKCPTIIAIHVTRRQLCVPQDHLIVAYVGRNMLWIEQHKKTFCMCDGSTSIADKKFPIQWVLDAVSPGVARPGREADHSTLSSADVKNSAAVPPVPLHGAMLN